MDKIRTDMREKKKYPIRRIFILDEISIVAAFFAALLMRYRHRFYTWSSIFDGLYVTLLVTFVVFQLMVFFIYDVRRKSIFVQDPFENLMSVIKSRLLLMILSIFYLYVVQRGEDSSRFVLGVFGILSVVLGFAFRMIYRKIYLKANPPKDEGKTLIVSECSIDDGGFFRAKVNGLSVDENGLIETYKAGDYESVTFVPGMDSILSGANNSAGKDGVRAKNTNQAYTALANYCAKMGARLYNGITSDDGYITRSGVISGVLSDKGVLAVMPTSIRDEKFNLFGIHYAIARTEEAVYHVLTHLKDLSGQYICFSNVHTSVMGRESEEYRNVLNSAAICFPDGKPIATLEQKKGYADAERVAGPDFMEHMFRASESFVRDSKKVAHYFYGASPETIEVLKKNLHDRYPDMNVVGMYSPPFRALSEEEDAEIVEMINNSGADILWVGLGAPKQEKWMLAHKNKINAVMMGVGAGFDFHAGTIKRAPLWIQKIGLEWLFRLFQDPGRLFKRYFVTNVKFIWYLMFSSRIVR